MNCLAFVPRLDHGSLYLVSKLHRSLMLSPELYQARSLMGRTEHCIYLCLRNASDPFVRWYAFYPKAAAVNHPSPLVPIRPHLYQPPAASSVVAHGWGIYVIGGMIGGKRSSRVFFHDVSSSLCCGRRGGREDIPFQMGSRGFRSKEADMEYPFKPTTDAAR